MSNLSDKPWLVPGHMYQYDIGWLVQKILSFETELNTAIDLKTIHYADPIQWDITTQYAPNTVVVDPKTGTAYMSKVPVPAGVLLTNTDYWVVIFNYQRIYDKIMSGVAFNDKDNLNATKDLLVNDLVWYGGDLYRCTRAIPQGTTYIPGTNLTPTTIADCLATYYGRDRMAQVLNDTVNVSGDYTINAGDIAETASHVTIHSTRDMLMDADGNLTEQVTGNKTSEVGGKLTEHITGNREIDVDGDDSIQVDGVTSINRGGAVTEVYGSSRDVGIEGAYTATAKETVINSDKLNLNVTDPIVYNKTPTKKDSNFNSIPLATPDGQIYDVLVYRKPLSNGLNTQIGYNGSFITNHDLTHKYIYLQGGTYLNGFYYIYLFETEANGIIYKINAETGTYTYKEFTNLYHGNGMCTDGVYIYITAWGSSASAPYKVYKLDDNLNILTSYSTPLELVNIAYDKVTHKFYGTTGVDVYELIMSNTIAAVKTCTITGYYAAYTVQGICVNDGVLYYAYSAPESILKINIDGTGGELIVLDNIVNNLFQLGELEDLEYIDGRLYTMSYNRSNMSVTQHAPSLIVFGNLGLDNNTIFESIDPRRDTIFVGNAVSLKCTGSSDNPFNDTQQAVFACQGMHAVYPVTYNIKINALDRVYSGVYPIGNCVKEITPVSGKPKVKFIRTRNAMTLIKDLVVYGSVTNMENILCDDSLVTLNTIDPASVDIIASRCFITGNASFVNLVGVMGTTQNAALDAGKVVYSGLTGTFKCYPKTTMYMHDSGAPISLNGVEVAKSVAVTTTPTTIRWTRIMPNDVSLEKYSDFIFIIDNIGYHVCGDSKLNLADKTLNIKFANGRFTLSATSNMTIFNIIAIR